MRVLVLTAALCFSSSLSLLADVQERLKAATDVLQEILSTPDKGIPQNLLDDSYCVAVVPGLKKGALISIPSGRATPRRRRRRTRTS